MDTKIYMPRKKCRRFLFSRTWVRSGNLYVGKLCHENWPGLEHKRENYPEFRGRKKAGEKIKEKKMDMVCAAHHREWKRKEPEPSQQKQHWWCMLKNISLRRKESSRVLYYCGLGEKLINTQIQWINLKENTSQYLGNRSPTKQKVEVEFVYVVFREDGYFMIPKLLLPAKSCQ